jgi:hypothetical protein
MSDVLAQDKRARRPARHCQRDQNMRCASRPIKTCCGVTRKLKSPASCSRRHTLRSRGEFTEMGQELSRSLWALALSTQATLLWLLLLHGLGIES